MKQQNQTQIANVGLSLEQIDGFESLKCGCGVEEFVEVIKIKKLPAILSPTGQPGIVQMRSLRCVKCGAEMNPVTGISKEKDGGKEPEQKEG